MKMLAKILSPIRFCGPAMHFEGKFFGLVYRVTYFETSSARGAEGFETRSSENHTIYVRSITFCMYSRWWTILVKILPPVALSSSLDKYVKILLILLVKYIIAWYASRWLLSYKLCKQYLDKIGETPLEKFLGETCVLLIWILLLLKVGFGSVAVFMLS